MLEMGSIGVQFSKSGAFYAKLGAVPPGNREADTDLGVF